MMMKFFSYLVISLSIYLTHVNADTKYNILFIASDDLTKKLGCYGDPVAKTPHLDSLAKQGVLFNKAYCQLPLCNPTRASLMTGLRPDTVKVYDLVTHFRDQVPNIVTLPQLFKQHQYRSMRVGKIYHYNVPGHIGTSGMDDEASWHEVVNPKGRDVDDTPEFSVLMSPFKKNATFDWLAAEGKDEEQTDGMVATEAIRLMQENKNKPFFLGVGFFRPHRPFVAPKKYFDLYPIDTIKLPYAPEQDRLDIPNIAFPHNCPIPHFGLKEEEVLLAKQAYYASVSFMDAQVGRLLQALKDLDLYDKTIVVFWSDHGFHLGEHQGLWHKRTLFEESASAPLIIYHPKAQGNGIVCDRVVEFIDIYPTLTDLCQLPTPKPCEGKSLKPLLENPKKVWNGEAFTQIIRPGHDGPVMGSSIKTERWRYTEWNRGQQGLELYDHKDDPLEFNNLADQVKYSEVITDLRTKLRKQTLGFPPEGTFVKAKL